MHVVPRGVDLPMPLTFVCCPPSGWSPVVQSRAEPPDGDGDRWAAWSRDHGGLRGPRQDLAGSERPGGGLLRYRVAALYTPTVQRPRRLVSDRKERQNLQKIFHIHHIFEQRVIFSSRSEPVGEPCAHWPTRPWLKSPAWWCATTSKSTPCSFHRTRGGSPAEPRMPTIWVQRSTDACASCLLFCQKEPCTFGRFLSFAFCGQVIYTESLTSPLEDEDPLCRSVPVTGCQAAVFIPSQPARLAVVHGGERTNSSVLTVFDVSLEKTKYKSSIQGEEEWGVCSGPLETLQPVNHSRKIHHKLSCWCKYGCNCAFSLFTWMTGIF